MIIDYKMYLNTKIKESINFKNLFMDFLCKLLILEYIF